MKTAEEWLTDPNNDRRSSEQDIVEWIKQIQLDAYKAGMSEAARLVKEYYGLLTSAPETILTARDNKTTLHP